MDLQQEYYGRHAITAPLVVYPDGKYGFHNLVVKNLHYRKFKQSRFMVLNMSSHKQEAHPSMFKFTQQIPVRDSTHSMKHVWDKKVEWDEWEPFILEWAENNRGELSPLSGLELFLATWEIFGYCNDSWLASNLLDRHKDSFYLTLDESVPIEDRLKIIDCLEDYINTKNKSIVAALANIRAFGADKHYASWLAKLL